MRSANYLDIATTGGFLVIIFLAALFLDDVDQVLVAGALLVFVALVALSLTVALRCMWMCYLQRGKKYEYFATTRLEEAPLRAC